MRARRGGYLNPFEDWQTEINAVRDQSALDQEEVINRILIGLQELYNAGSLALEAGEHASPPKRIVVRDYDELVSPLTANGNRTLDDVAHVVTTLNARMQFMPPLPPRSGRRRTQRRSTRRLLRLLSRRTRSVRKMRS